jgi:hypothetical protein
MDANEILKLIGHHKKIIRELEEDLERASRGESASWVPQRFYTAYYILAGLGIGMVAAWITLILNSLGSYLLQGDALKLLRVYGTFFAGQEAMQTNKAAILMLSVLIHTLTGAVCGAPIHVVVCRFYPGLKLPGRLLAGVILGFIMWSVNIYGILSWLQPLLLGDGGPSIVKEIPVWVAVSNHVAFTVLMLLFQPLGTFSRSPAAPPTGAPAAHGR